MNRFFLVVLCLLCACHRASDDTTPKLDISVQDRYLQQLPSPFAPLNVVERASDWGKEYQIALGFAHELDLYQAITAFKRAAYLMPAGTSERRTELEYEILLCYYLGKKYGDVIYTFERGPLRFAEPTFAAHEDLLVILYDTYLHLDEKEKSDRILAMIRHYYPATAEKLALSGTLMSGDIPSLRNTYGSNPSVEQILKQYDVLRKSPSTAQSLNAFIPGSGYLYLGQKQSAITAFLLNGLFIWAAVHFFQHGNIAAGVITTSFEAGWYFGGIYGAGQEARFYNQRVYEHAATPVMNENRLFPILMLNHAF